MEENRSAEANYAVIHDYNDLRHHNGEETEFFMDSDGDEETFDKKLDKVYKNLAQESDIWLEDINNTKEILDKLRSDAKDINDKIKKTPIQIDDQKVKILDQDNLNTLNDQIKDLNELASSFNYNKERLGEILDKKYRNNSYIKTYPSKSPRNYKNLRDNFNWYRISLKTIKQNIIKLYGENQNIAETEIDNTLQRIKENQNFNLKTIKDVDNSCNIF